MTTELATRAGLDLSRLDYNTPVRIETSGEPIVLSVRTVLQFVAPGAPPADALKFLFTCRSAKLNPLLGEAFLVPMGGKWATVVAKFGYVNRGIEHPLYDGHESGLTLLGGGKMFDIPGTIRPNGCQTVGGWCKVWRKGQSRPVYKRLSLDEYRKPTKTWNELGNTMIEKCAIVAAFREAFSLGGYDEAETEAELPSKAAAVTVQVTPKAIEPEVVEEPEPGPRTYRTDNPVDVARPELIRQIDELILDLGISTEDMAAALAKRGVTQLEDLMVTQAEEILSNLRYLASQKQADEVFGPGEPPEAEETTLPDVTRGGEDATA